VPAHVAVLADGGARAIDLPGRASSPAPETLVTPHAVTFEAADGMRIPAQLFLPPAGAPGAGGRRPAVVFFHGGPRRQMLLGWHYRLYYHHAYSLNQYLASRGMVVLSVNYRSGIGYGRDFREATDYGAAGASEFNDVTGAARYLRSRDDVDPARIAAWGGSYGGYLTAMALARAPDLYATGVDIHGVHDWNAVIRNFHPEYDPLRRPETAAKAWASSPLASLDRWRAPVLVIHGDDDRNVPFSETVDLVARLRTRGVEVEQLVLPNEVHTFLRHESWVRVCTATVEYLQKKLSPAAAGHTGGDR
jgi:dipeptidyl aminopeptidase/acylaminoacyl peptidase